MDGFLLDAYPVTNAQYAAFVAATGHVTLAERAPDPAEYPAADPALLVPASAVFIPHTHWVDLRDAYQWWSHVPGADWRHPRGPGSDLSGLDDHPVVHVAYDHTATYAAWAGKRPPTEPNGSTPPAVATTAWSTPGVTTSPPTAVTWPTCGRANSEWSTT